MNKKPVLFRITNNFEIGGIQCRLRYLLPELMSSFEVHAVTYNNKGILFDELSQKGVQMHHIPFRGNLDPVCLLRLRRLFLEHKADIVHCHSFGGNISGIIAASLAKVKVRIGHVHTREYHWHRRSRPHRVKQIIEEALLHRYLGHKVIFVSESTRKYFLERTHLPERKSIVIYNGIVHPPNFNLLPKGSLKKKFGLDPKKKIIAFVGRSGRGKGLNYFREFARNTMMETNEYTFIAVGVDHTDCNDEIHYYGPQTDIFKFYSIIDCLLYTSRPGVEGLGNVVLEAGAMDIPILARESEVLHEIKSHYNKIFFIDDTKSTLQNLHTAINCPEPINNTIMENFSLDKMKKETLKLYDSLL